MDLKNNYEFEILEKATFNILDVSVDNNFLITRTAGITYLIDMQKYIDVEEVEIKNSSLYPNPTNNVLNIEFTLLNDENVSIELVDLQGQVLERIGNDYYHSGLNVIQYDCSELATGTYFVKIYSAGLSKSYRFVKM